MVESSAFQRCYSVLQKGIQYELSEIVPRLYAKNLISTGNKEKALSQVVPPFERADHLLTVLLNRIRIDPPFFYSILQELDSCPTLKFLAEKLRSALEDPRGRRARERDETDVLTHTETGQDRVLKACKLVKEPTSQCREKLEESLAYLQQVQAEITAAISAIQTAKREVAENHATVSDTINQSIDQLIEILQQRKKDLLAKASQLAQEKLGALNTQEKSLNMSLAEARSMADFVERSLKNATNKALLELQQQIVTGVEECCKKQQQVDLQPAAKANIGINMSCDQQALRTVGSVGLDVIDHTKHRAEGVDNKEVEINKPAQFTLHLMAEVKSHVDGSVVPATITPVRNGAFSATYTPHVRGRHYITVRVNGREMSDSPFSVFVQIPPAQLQKPVRTIDGINSPWGIAISNNDEVLVAENKGARVSVFDKQGRKLRTIQHEDLPQPVGVTSDPDGSIYILYGRNKIVKCDKDGQVQNIGNISDSGHPRLIQVINDMLFVCCGRSDRILVYDCRDLQLIRSLDKQGEGNGEFHWPYDVLSVNGEVYVSDCNNHRIQVFDQEELSFIRLFKIEDPSTQKLYKPRGICVGPDGLLYVACGNFNCVLVFTLRGEFVASLGGIAYPRGVAVDSDGFIYVTCEGDSISVF